MTAFQCMCRYVHTYICMYRMLLECTMLYRVDLLELA